jgi:hypothetical protein
MSLSPNPKVYWVGLLRIIRLLCKYYKKWGSLLPSDLPPAVTAVLAGITAACSALEAYDAAHKRGQ